MTVSTGLKTYFDDVILIQLFDRWTFQKVNALTIECNCLKLDFIKGGIKSTLPLWPTDGVWIAGS